MNKKRLLLFTAALGFILCICGCSKQTEYKTSTVWENKTDYVFSVEADYDGDIYKAGTYEFTPVDVDTESGKTPVVWEIYVSETLYDNINDLKPEEKKASVGGTDNTSTTIDLKQGQYVYILYKGSGDNTTGNLQVKKTD